MDADDFRDADWAIVDVLREGRANAPLIAEKTGYSAQYVRERLGRMKEDNIVESLDHGMYAVNEPEVPARAGGEQAKLDSVDAGEPSLEDALDGLTAVVNYAEDRDLEEIALQAAALYQKLGDQAPDEDWDETDPSEVIDALGMEGDPDE